MKWLISDLDFYTRTDDLNNETELYKMIDKEGIVCQSWAMHCFHGVRFKYIDPDCPKCGRIGGCWIINRGKEYKCKNCHNKFSIQSSTYLQDSKLDFYYWWRLSFLIGEKKITNIFYLSKDLKLSYKTTHGMIKKIRISGNHYSLEYDHMYQIIENLLTIKSKDNE